MEKMTCNQTRSVTSGFLVYKELNDKDTMFGGDILSHFDITGGRTVYKYARRPSFTASVDAVEFLRPVYDREFYYVESYVTGHGRTSIEVFAKLLGQYPQTGENFLCAYAFMTYVLQDRGPDLAPLPELVPESEEEKMLCAGYEERQALNRQKRSLNRSLPQKLEILPVWEQNRGY